MGSLYQCIMHILIYPSKIVAKKCTLYMAKYGNFTALSWHETRSQMWKLQKLHHTSRHTPWVIVIGLLREFLLLQIWLTACSSHFQWLILISCNLGATDSVYLCRCIVGLSSSSLRIFRLLVYIMPCINCFSLSLCVFFLSSPFKFIYKH